MMANFPISHYIDRAQLGIWSKEDILNVSVKAITEQKSFVKGGACHPEGLYSPALGPTKRFDLCTTCGLSEFNCSGHYGHIDLSVPVYHPMLVQVLYQILNKACLECFHFRLPQGELKLFLAQLEALNYGFDHLIDELDEIMADMSKDGKIDSNDTHTQMILGMRLMDRIKEEKAKIPDFDCKKRQQQRTIVERLAKLFRNFLNGHLVKPSKVCPYCSEKKVSISLHQSSVMVVGVNSSKAIDELDVIIDTYAPTEVEDGPRKKLKTSARGRGSKGKAAKEKKKKPIKYDNLDHIVTDDKKYLTPIGAKNYLKKLWVNEKHVLQTIFRFLDIRAENKVIENESKEDEIDDDNSVPHIKQEQDEDPKQKLKQPCEFHPVDNFFIEAILVPPSKFRPPMMQQGYSYEGPRTGALSNVLKHSIQVRDMLDQIFSETDDEEAERLHVKLQSNWKALQVAVNCIYDNELDKYGKAKYPGLKQLIDKKAGLFRKNMMGKRVNFAARSVISPDPNISVDQIGVPLVFAKKLTYPEPVTPMNLSMLRKAVMNGPENYPGAHSVTFDDGVTISLAKETVRHQIATRLSFTPRPQSFNSRSVKQTTTPLCTIVNRHLVTGDVLLFNRQPTLHKPSIMAFRARVLPNEKGFRLHYANCKSFNADFDGDEMNAHLPQNELARSEAYNIASVNYQYLVPKDGSPLGGLIQDHVVAVCILTSRDKFLDKERYYQLVYCALAFLEKPIVYEPPAIIKPTNIWTGKQVITSIIKNCIPTGKLPPTLNIKSKIGPKLLNIDPKYTDLSDCNVIIRNGELLKGFMDKTNVGATQYGLIHLCYELYGGVTSSNLMSAFARLSTIYLQMYEGFTLGIKDIVVDDDANLERKKLIKESTKVGPESAMEALSINKDDAMIIQDDDGDGSYDRQLLEDKMRDAHSDRDPLPMKLLDGAMKSRTDKYASSISGRCLPGGLIVPFPDNNLQMMIQSGAKGGTVNALQISCLLGQIELEGRRVPLSMSGRSLPSFKPYDPSPKAGGFVTGRFLTGIQPQEFFFHCMAGREGLIDTAVKTSRSGYLQRCLIKHLEGITVHYDQTVRDSCGSVIQFLYGEDGLDIVKSQMLKEKAFTSLVNNYEIVKPDEEEVAKLQKAKEGYEEEVIAHSDLIQQWMELNGAGVGDTPSSLHKGRGSGFMDFLNTKKTEMKEKGCDDDEQIIDLSPQSSRCPSPKSPQSSMVVGNAATMNKGSEDTMYISSFGDNKTDSQRHDHIFAEWYELSFKEKRKWNKFWEACPDPLTAILNPAAHFGVVPERLDQLIESFARANPKLIYDWINEPDAAASISEQPKLTKQEFYNICYNLYMKMMAQPGEAVGLLAAQSIGEPSTQMTLNTFHFAGRGEMNVTLGIPRLREILMTASAKIGTPSMDLPGLPIMRDEFGNELSSEQSEEQMNRVRLALNAVKLSDVLEYIDISEQVLPFSEIFDQLQKQQVAGSSKASAAASIFNSSISGKGTKRKLSSLTDSSSKGAGSRPGGRAKRGEVERQAIRYEIEMRILPSKYYRHEFQCNSSKVMKFIEEIFIGQLVSAMLNRQKRLLMGEQIFDLATKRSLGNANKDAAGDGELDADAEEDDLENYNAKAKQRGKESGGAGAGDDVDASSSDDDEDLGGGGGQGNNSNSGLDGDNTTDRLKSRRNQDLDYDEPEDEDLDVGEMEAKGVAEEEDDVEILLDQEDKQAAAVAAAAAARAANELDDVDIDVALDNDPTTTSATNAKVISLSPDNEIIDLANIDIPTPDNDEADDGAAANDSRVTRSGRKKDKKSKSPIVSDFHQSNPNVIECIFDSKKERWCRVTICFELAKSRLDMAALIDQEARKTYVHRVGNIQRALIVDDTSAKERGSKCLKMIKTEGVSLLSLVRFNHIIDLNAIYSNDIHAIARTYGIEAAAHAIRREMANVFAVYGIEVDSRHLSLIADYMTYSGYIRGMNRMSMEANASPFQQMSFESTLRYLKSAAILGFHDDIRSPSASLVFGRPTRGGTGIFAPLANPRAQLEWQQEAANSTRRTANNMEEACQAATSADEAAAAALLDPELNWD